MKIAFADTVIPAICFDVNREKTGKMKPGQLKGDSVAHARGLSETHVDAGAFIIGAERHLSRIPDFDKIEKNLKAKVIFDGRNLSDLQKMIDCRYYYDSIGRKVVEA